MIHNLLLIIKKKFILIFLIFWIIIVFSAIYTFSRKPIFKAYAGIVLKEESLKQNTLHILSDDIFASTARKLTFITPNTTDIYKEQAINFLKSSINIEIDKDLDLLKIFVLSPDPAQAALIANIHATVFIERFLDNLTDTSRKELLKFMSHEYAGLKSSIQSISDNATLKRIEKKLSKRLNKARKEKKRLLKKYSKHHPEVILLTRSIKLISLQLEQADEQRRLMQKALHKIDDKRSKIARKKYANDAVQTLSQNYLIPAQTPEKPYYPDVRNYFIISLSLALIISIATAFFIERQNSFTGSFSEIESYLHIPVLISIPHIERRKKNIAHYFRLRKRDRLGEKRSRLIVFHPLGSRLAQSYKVILEKITDARSDPGQIVLVTSSGNREGKTTTAANLAISASLSGTKTLLCDFNLRFPIISGIFGLYPQPGLSDIIMQHIPVHDTIQSAKNCKFTTISAHNDLFHAGLKNLYFMSAGKPVSYTDALFKKHDIGMILSYLKNEFELIILDSSSVLHFNDSLTLSTYADKVLFVYRSGRLSRGVVKEAIDDTLEVSGKIDGLVFNDTNG